MSKVVLIGIDGLDPFLIKKWIDCLPNFNKITCENSFFITKSTFPYDSICAWSSIFTGKN
ncbi:MAG: alkaline phosphatase family protein, partial [Promethearchaeota archaeon]